MPGRADARAIPLADLANCAGVIDSDGCIRVKRSTYAMRHGNGGQANYSETVCVKQVEPHAVELLHNLFGGYYSKAPASCGKGKPLFVWQVTDLRAAECLKALLPFLRIKKQQAENCRGLRKIKESSKKARVSRGRGHVGAAVRSADHSAAMDASYRRAKELNLVGKVVVGCAVGRQNQG